VEDLDSGRHCHVEITDDVDLEWLETFDLRGEFGVGEKQGTT
jgi:hypothetical protein